MTCSKGQHKLFWFAQFFLWNRPYFAFFCNNMVHIQPAHPLSAAPVCCQFWQHWFYLLFGLPFRFPILVKITSFIYGFHGHVSSKLATRQVWNQVASYICEAFTSTALFYVHSVMSNSQSTKSLTEKKKKWSWRTYNILIYFW